MQSQCRIRSRESGMWGVGVGGGGWQKVKEQKKKVNIRGKVGGIRCDGLLCIYVHLCCAHTASKAGMHAAEREKKNNGKTVEFNTGTP